MGIGAAIAGIVDAIGSAGAEVAADVGIGSAAAAGTGLAEAATGADLAAGISEVATVTAPSLVGGGITAADALGAGALAAGGLAASDTAAAAAPAASATATPAAPAPSTPTDLSGGLGAAPTDTTSTLNTLGTPTVAPPTATPAPPAPTPTISVPTGPPTSPGGINALATPNATGIPTPATGAAGGGSSAISGGGLGGGGLGGGGGLSPDLTATGGADGTGLTGAASAPSTATVGGGAGAAGITPNAVGLPAFDPSSLGALPTVPGATGASSGGVSGILSDLGINSVKDGLQVGGALLGGVEAISGLGQANKDQAAVSAAENTVTGAIGTQAAQTANLNNTIQQQTASLNSTLAPLTTQANSAASQATTLENYMTTGTLPPGAQATINQSLAAAQAAIKGKYASLGLSGSTMETQDLNAAANTATTQVTNLALQLYNTGVSQAGIANTLYQAIISGQSDILNANVGGQENIEGADTSVLNADIANVGATSGIANTANAAIANYAAALSGSAATLAKTVGS